MLQRYSIMEPSEKTAQVLPKLGVIALALIISFACFSIGDIALGIVVFAIGIAFVVFVLGTRKPL